MQKTDTVFHKSLRELVQHKPPNKHLPHAPDEHEPHHHPIEEVGKHGAERGEERHVEEPVREGFERARQAIQLGAKCRHQWGSANAPNPGRLRALASSGILVINLVLPSSDKGNKEAKSGSRLLDYQHNMPVDPLLKRRPPRRRAGARRAGRGGARRRTPVRGRPSSSTRPAPGRPRIEWCIK